MNEELIPIILLFVGILVFSIFFGLASSEMGKPCKGSKGY